MADSSNQIPRQSSATVNYSENDINDELNWLSKTLSTSDYINSMQSHLQAEASTSNTNVFKAISNFLLRAFTATKNFVVVKKFIDVFKGLMSYIKSFTKKDNVEQVIDAHPLLDDNLYEKYKGIIKNWCKKELKNHKGRAERKNVTAIATKFLSSINKQTGVVIVDSSFNELDYQDIRSFPFNMVFKGNLFLNNLQNLKYFPPITVLGDLYIDNFNGQMLSLSTKLNSVPFIVTGDFSIKDSNIFSSLPKYLDVGGDFDIRDCDNFTNWPDDFKCGQDISVINCSGCAFVPDQILEMGLRYDGKKRNVTIELPQSFHMIPDRFVKMKSDALQKKIASNTDVDFNISYKKLKLTGKIKYFESNMLLKLLSICEILNDYSILDRSAMDGVSKRELSILGHFIDEVMFTADFIYDSSSRKNVAKKLLIILNELKNKRHNDYILSIMSDHSMSYYEALNLQMDEILTKISFESERRSFYSGAAESSKVLEVVKYIFFKNELLDILHNRQDKAIEFTVTDEDGNTSTKTLRYDLTSERYIQDACLFLRIKLNEFGLSFPNIPQFVSAYEMWPDDSDNSKNTAIEAIAEHLKEHYDSKFSDFLKNWEPWQETLRSKEVESIDYNALSPIKRKDLPERLKNTNKCVMTKLKSSKLVFYAGHTYDFDSIKKVYKESGKVYFTKEDINLKNLRRVI